MNKWYDSEAVILISTGMLLMMVCLGVGTCCMLVKLEIKPPKKDPSVEKIIKKNPKLIENVN
jgi:hypothetical protein